MKWVVAVMVIIWGCIVIGALTTERQYVDGSEVVIVKMGAKP